MTSDMGKDVGNTASTGSAIWTSTDEQTAEAVERKCGITLVPSSTDI